MLFQYLQAMLAPALPPLCDQLRVQEEYSGEEASARRAMGEVEYYPGGYLLEDRRRVYT